MHYRAAANVGHWRRTRRYFGKQLWVVSVIPDALPSVASRASLGLIPKQLYLHPKLRLEEKGLPRSIGRC